MSTARTELGGRHGRGPRGTDPATPLRFGYTPTVSHRKIEIIPGLTHIDCKLLPFYTPKEMEGFLDMTQLIKESSLNWSSLDSYIQELSTYGGKTWSLPGTFDLGTIAALSCHAAATWLLTSSSFTPSGATDTLFFRKDILDRHGLSPPATWRDLLELAERFNGTNTETGEGEGDLFGTCFYWQNAACATPTYATAREWSAHGRGGGEGLTRTRPQQRPQICSTLRHRCCRPAAPRRGPSLRRTGSSYTSTRWR